MGEALYAVLALLACGVETKVVGGNHGLPSRVRGIHTISRASGVISCVDEETKMNSALVESTFARVCSRMDA
jgi:hypothetical protein